MKLFDFFFNLRTKIPFPQTEADCIRIKLYDFPVNSQQIAVVLGGNEIRNVAVGVLSLQMKLLPDLCRLTLTIGKTRDVDRIVNHFEGLIPVHPVPGLLGAGKTNIRRTPHQLLPHPVKPKLRIRFVMRVTDRHSSRALCGKKLRSNQSVRCMTDHHRIMILPHKPANPVQIGKRLSRQTRQQINSASQFLNLLRIVIVLLLMNNEIKLKPGSVNVPVQIHYEVLHTAGIHGTDNMKNTNGLVHASCSSFICS